MHIDLRSLYSSICFALGCLLLLLTTDGRSQDVATIQVPDDPKSIVEGRSLFGQHCTVCHAVDKQIIGPALASVHNRRPVDWLVRFIQNSQHVIIDQEDEYAQHLYQQYEQQVMPNFEFLSRDEILSILAYIKAESTTGVSNINEPPTQKAQSPTEQATSVDTGVDSMSPLVMMLMGIILLLIMIIVVSAVRNRTKSNV